MFIRFIASALIAALMMFGVNLAPQTGQSEPAAIKATPTPETVQVTEEKARDIALTHAALTLEEIEALRVQYDPDEGKPDWDVEFRSGDFEYDYEICAETGKILEWDKEYEPKKNTAAQPAPAEPAPAPETKTLTAGEAVSAALAHAKLTEAEVTGLRTKLDSDDRKPHFDVEFRSGNYEYDYEISATTGKVLEWDKEYEPVKTAAPKPEKPAEPDGVDALAIALERAGLTKDQVTRIKTEKDFDDGRWVYEVEFRNGKWEYEFEICAETGKILEWDKEIDD